MRDWRELRYVAMVRANYFRLKGSVFTLRDNFSLAYFVANFFISRNNSRRDYLLKLLPQFWLSEVKVKW